MAFSEERFYIDFLHSTDTTQFQSEKVKTFHSALFIGESLWICGWNKNRSIVGQKNIVFFNVDLRGDYNVLSESKFNYPAADQPIVMFTAADTILFAKRDGNEIHSFNTKTSEFRRVFRRSDLTISAMCGSKNFVYIFDKNQSDHIQVLDYSFHASGRTATGLGPIHDCQVDMSSIDDTIVISTSFPLGSVRLLKRNRGVIWHMDIWSNPELPTRFNPCSVSITPDSEIFFADRYDNKVSKTSMSEKNTGKHIRKCKSHIDD